MVVVSGKCNVTLPDVFRLAASIGLQILRRPRLKLRLTVSCLAKQAISSLGSLSGGTGCPINEHQHMTSHNVYFALLVEKGVSPWEVCVLFWLKLSNLSLITYKGVFTVVKCASRIRDLNIRETNS